MIAEMVDSVVFAIVTKIGDTAAPNLKLYSNKHSLEALYTIGLVIWIKIDGKAVICQVKHIM